VLVCVCVFVCVVAEVMGAAVHERCREVDLLYSLVLLSFVSVAAAALQVLQFATHSQHACGHPPLVLMLS